MRVVVASLLLGLALVASSQDRLKGMPGYKAFAQAQLAAGTSAPVLARANGSWDDATHYRFTFAGQNRVYDATTNKVTVEPIRAGEMRMTEEGEASGFSGRPFQSPARGRQFASVQSSDGKKATYQDGNVTLTADGKTVKVTTDGDLTKRLKYGTASWVYGEELEQKDAMGFSPDGRYLWYYRFNESAVLDYFVLNGINTFQDVLAVEAYPKPGKPNPKVDLYVYDTKTAHSTKVKVREGEFDDRMGHYVYGIFWRPDSRALVFHRMNRAQNELELDSFDAETGAVTPLYREANPKGWVDYGPLNRPVPGGLSEDSLITFSEASGFMNLIRIDLKKGGATPITKLNADVLRVTNLDTAKGTVDFVAADGAGPYRPQYHRAKLDGSSDIRLTDPEASHEVRPSPDGQLFVDAATYPGKAPEVRVLDAGGKVKAVLATSDTKAFTDAGFAPAEFFSFPSLDGKETLYGYVHRPRNFDPSRKYPMLLDVYGGPLPPLWGSPVMEWKRSNSMANYGFLIVEVMGRGGQARGRDFRQAIYHNLGGVEIDDFAAAVTELRKRPYVDGGRVGIFGTSYGGFSSAMALCRYPDLFQAASASSMVGDWRNYDSTYTERYMGLIPSDLANYERQSILRLVPNVKGWLMLYFGTADDNTHMANTLQFADALRRAGKSFEVQVGVDRGHSGVGQERMLEFFIERLVMGPGHKEPPVQD